jgi:hypothetical protein
LRSLIATTFAHVATCSTRDTYVVVVDVGAAKMLSIIDVGGAIIMISHSLFFQEIFYLSFPKCIVGKIVKL